MHVWNWVDEAVALAGGPVQASVLLRVSPQTTWRWRQVGRMPLDSPEARERLEQLAQATGITVAQLAGLDPTLPQPREEEKGDPDAIWPDDDSPDAAG